MNDFYIEGYCISVILNIISLPLCYYFLEKMLHWKWNYRELEELYHEVKEGISGRDSSLPDRLCTGD